MAPQDLWYLKKRHEKEEPRPSKRHGRGDRYRVNYVDPLTGRATSKSFPDKKKGEAERFERNIKSDIDRGTYIDPAAGKILVADYADRFVELLQVRPQTKTNVRSSAKNHVRGSAMGRLPLLAVRSAVVQEWVQERRKKDPPLAASSIRTIYKGLVFPMFKRAQIDGLIPSNPCVEIVLPELPDGEYDLPSPSDVRAMAVGFRGYYEPVVYLGAGCGMRTGEMFGLELGSVDFLRRTVKVRHQLAMSTRGAPYLAPPKTKTSKRTIELPKLALDALARHVRDHPPREVLIWDRTNPDKPVQRKALLLFVSPEGSPMRSGRWSDIWQAGIKKTDLPEDLYTVTSLRHFFATALIYAGKNVRTVQMAMGHSKPTVTLETYLGYWPDDERDGTRAVLDATFDAGSDSSRTQSVPGKAK